MAGANRPSSSYLPDALGHDLATFGERVEVLARRPTVGAGVLLGQVAHRGEEGPERLDGHAAHLAQVGARPDQLRLGGDVLGPFLDRQRHPHEGHPRSGADPVAMACSNP